MTRLAGTARAAASADPDIRERLAALTRALGQIRQLRRSYPRSFYDIGLLLRDVRDRRLYGAKGYSTFESFVDREVDLGRMACLRLVRIVETFVREAALALGLERLTACIDALWEDSASIVPSVVAVSTAHRTPPVAANGPAQRRDPSARAERARRRPAR
ncbi:MAG: hypothetical protein RMK74_02385 [Myxococcales bacterium]|nr:hypothetical protein [Myxococcales bacterium]